MASISDLASANTVTNRSSVSETGHAKNVANFESLITFCIGYGTAYNPTYNLLSVSKLQSQFENAKLCLLTVKETKEPFDQASGARQLAFKPLRPLVTRAVNALVAQNASKPDISDTRTIIRKLNGQRATGNTPEATPASTISVSQQSYDRLADTFQEIIVKLQNIAVYTPNETELTTSALQTLHSQLVTANTNVRTAYVPYSNALINRNNDLYQKENNLIDIAIAVKTYVKSVFGARSPQYKQISGLVFRRPKL